MNKFNFKQSISRRSMIKNGLVVGASTLAMPFISKYAMASSGELNVFAWGDYIQENVVEAFTKKTGIKVNVSTYGSNEEAQNKLRAAGGKGFDLIFPSVDTRPDYDSDHLLQVIDENRINVDAIVPSIWRNSIELGAVKRGNRYMIPFDWGTEAITYDSSKHNIAQGELSYSHLWEDNLVGKVAGRQKSLLVSLAIYLDSTGQVPSNRGMDLYKSEADMRRVFDECLAFAAKRKENLGAFWNNGTEATAAFTDSGCTIGQTWDTTGIKLHNDVDSKWRYACPKEGALAWMDTIAMPSGAENIDQAYEFINFLLTPEIGGMVANNTGYNSAAVGAENHLTAESKAAFEMAYAGDAIDQLWWWPVFTPWFSSVRQEYVEKLTTM